MFVSVFSQDRAPRQLYSDLDAEATRRTIGPYLSFAYLLDPFYGLFKSDVGTSVVSLDDCAPDDFRASDYYQMFYSDIALRNEVTIFVAAGHGTSIVISVGQRGSCRGDAATAKAALTALLPVIAGLLRQTLAKSGQQRRPVRCRRRPGLRALSKLQAQPA